MEIIYKIDDFPDPGDRDILNGIQEINQNRYPEALEHFEKASNYGNEYGMMLFAIAYIVNYGFHAERGEPEVIGLLRLISAKWNNPAAQYYIGCVYLEHNLDIDVDKKLAFTWLLLAAENEWSDAMARLAIAYFHGTFVERNYAKAVFWFEKIVAKYDNNKTENFTDDRLFLFEKENFEIKLLDKSQKASLGIFLDDNTYTALPMLFCRTLVPLETLLSELKQIFIWSTFTNKKTASVAISHYYLARIYSSGEINSHKDNSEHMNWLIKNARNNEKDAILLMGAAYENGIVVERDYKKAMEWYEKAYNLAGAKEIGAVGIGRLYHTGKGVKKNCRTALTYYQEAHESRTFRPPYNLIGEIYESGEDGVLQSTEISRENYVSSYFCLNDPKGLTGMASIESVAIKKCYYFLRGAELGCPKANYILGEANFLKKISFFGSKEEHLKKALEFFKKADIGDYEAARPKIALVEEQLHPLPTR
ncbi:hypothetical protein BD770DRAFT_445606 [Pilaira anomala]|nr:hypothetical protein BD770DRAFT_445606 [Pilaira anomala]